MKSIRQFLQKPWLYLVIILIGVSLKFYRVDYRYFWFDEISTIQHTSGNQVFNSPVNEIMNITYYKNQLHLKTQSQTLGSQLKGLYNSTNLNPLHYTFLMIWYRIAGDSNRSYRYFNVFIILLILPVLYLLTKTLFKSDLAGWMAADLFVFSPFFHYYTHEARYNILLVFLICLLHYLFWKSITHNKIKWWIGYSLIGILSLYASVMSGLMLFGHLLYVLFFKKKIWMPYGINFMVILLSYLPWIISMINSSAEITSSLAWHTFDTPKLYFLRILPYQFMGFTKVFTNFSYYSILSLISYDFAGYYKQLILDIIFFVIILSAIIYTFKEAPDKVAFFLLLTILPHSIFYYISDLVRNAAGSMFWRYHAINFIGIILFVAFFLSYKTAKGKIIYTGIFLGLILFGLFSILVISEDRCYHIPLDCEKNIREAELFSGEERPLLITDYSMRLQTGIGGFMAILNRCESERIDILHASSGIKNVEGMLAHKSYSEVYVTHASDELVKNLKSQFGERIDSLEIEGISPTWQIKTN